jgi:long-subunit fatty acid transport protein
MGAAENNYIFGSSLAFRTFLIDTIAGKNGAIDGYQSLVPISSGVNQTFDSYTSGSSNELAFGWGGNVQDKLYLGASIVIPIVNFNRSLQVSETDLSTTNTTNQFSFFEFNEDFSSRGWGIGAKFGIIYKPESFLRVGFALHTPQLIDFRDRLSAAMTTNTESYAGKVSASSDQLNNGNSGLREYTVMTPTKATISGSYFFASPGKPTQPLGFISADIEWVNYAGTRFSSNDFDQEIAGYYDDLNNTMKATYKNNFNIRLGSEIKLTSNWMARAGTAYYGSPYKNEFADENGTILVSPSRMIVSGGIGYRTNKYFWDFTISSATNQDAVVPYRLIDKPSPIAEEKSRAVLFNIGFGIRF